ncbi:hypothetical protein ABXV24_10210 [Vibrio owensii]|uniref:hypothetical protein n=1 Tax=Vibrio owensii TaxID=696485 RepID=UPI0033994BE5
MNIDKRSEALTMASILLLAVFASPILANDVNEDQCRGAFSASINATPYKPSVTQPDTLWFQGKVILDNQLVHCVSSIVVKPSNGWQQVVSGPQGKVNSTILNTQRKSLNRNPQGDFLLPNRGAKQVDFWIQVPQGKTMHPGNYRADFDFSLLGSKVESVTKSAGLDYVIRPFVRARIEANSSSHVSVSGARVTVDMGNLTKQNRRDLDIVVVSNASVKLELDSLNHGHLVNKSKPSHKIPYTTSLQGQTLGLGSSVFLNTLESNQTRFNMAFENKAMPGAAAGRYEDEMTISLIAY